jgi:outer membrane receptor protein involved in Fe transport
LPQNLSLYAAARYVDSLPSIGIDSYLGVDFNLAWTPSERFRSSLTVQNLNDRRHLEFENSTFVERSAYLRLVWTF